MATDCRFSVRVDPKDKQLIEEAAHLSGFRTLSSFVAATMVRAAKEIRREELHRTQEEFAYGVRTLSDFDRDTILNLLENPPEPNEKLKALMKDSHKEHSA